MLFLGAHWRKPMDYTDETLAAAKARADGFREVFRNPSRAGGSWDDFVAALDDDFNTPEALAVMHEWRDHDLLRRGLEMFGLGSLAEEEEAPAELDELARRRAEARRAATSTRPTGCGRRSRRPAGRSATWRATPATGSSRSVTADQVYGRRAVREALRGRREVLELWATERALGAEPWLQENGGPRVQVEARARAERGGRHPRPPGRRRARRAVPVRGRLRARAGAEPAPRLPRPRDRSAQPRRGRAQRRRSGRDRDRRARARLGDGDAGGLPLLGRRGRARADRGRPEPRALPRTK